MSFTYPAKMYPLIRQNWKIKRWKDDFIPPLPDEEIVQKIVDVVYHASLLTEERRRIWFRVIYVSPKELKKPTSDFIETSSKGRLSIKLKKKFNMI